MSRVLLLEPDALVAGNVAMALKRHGHRVEWYVEPQSAIYGADGSRPDVIVLDLLLASHNGIEFLYELRSYPDWQKLPVVIFSDLAPEDLSPSVDCLNELNVTAYRRKSLTSLAELSQTVNAAL